MRIQRREFITLLGSAAVARPLSARAQQPARPVIGFLSARTEAADAQFVAAFRRGLTDAGRGDAAIQFRFADGQFGRLPALAADLLRAQVSAFATIGDAAALAARQVTTTLPIVFTAAVDPVELGLVESISRPGLNATGLTSFGSALVPKRLELLRELIPSSTVITVLVNPNNAAAAASQIREAEAAAPGLGLKVEIGRVFSENGFEKVFATISGPEARALLVGTDGLFLSFRDQLTATVARHKVPALYDRREYVIGGGLVSYGILFENYYRLLGVYAGRVLSGARPAELPVQRPSQFDLVINLKTAKALGLTVPPTLLARADEVIE
jgi:ABC-type uncharacterized transport system substrate-binding protein